MQFAKPSRMYGVLVYNTRNSKAYYRIVYGMFTPTHYASSINSISDWFHYTCNAQLCVDMYMCTVAEHLSMQFKANNT